MYIGCAILELSKLHMLDFHYNVIQKQFGNRAKLIYSDTDSFVYEIEHNNIYEWIKENKEYFDLSKSERPELNCKSNESALGKFKDELHSMVMTEFLGLDPKCYSFRFQKKDLAFDEVKRSKGVSKAVVKKTLPFIAYKKVLDAGDTVSRLTTNIGSFNQQLFTFDTNKIALNAFYDKMYMIGKIHTEPFGYKPTKDFEYYKDFINN